MHMSLTSLPLQVGRSSFQVQLFYARLGRFPATALGALQLLILSSEPRRQGFLLHPLVNLKVDLTPLEGLPLD